ncbi:MAG: DUF4012 domain-containing protein [Chloroflexi bacterium]|nr:MAG: DUF4012 domain-containing protein [Chloroflexota bacterium]
MSDTLTNSGPSGTGTTPVEENSEHNKTSQSDIPVTEQQDVSTQPHQPVAEDVTTKEGAQGSPSIADNASTTEEEDSQRLKMGEDGAKSDGEDRSSIAVEDGARSEEEDRSSTTAEISPEEEAENGAKVDGEVPEIATPVDASPPEAGNTAGTFSNGGTRAVVALAGRFARLRSDKRMLWIAIPLLVLVLAGTIVPTAMAIGYGMGAYSTYTTLRAEANDGLQHLLNVKTVFTGLNAHPTGFLDTGKLHRAQKESTAAHKDFQQVEYTLDHAAVIATVIQYLPQYRAQVSSAYALSRIGIDVTDIGQELVQAAMTLAPTFRGPLLNATNKPLVTPAMLALVRTTIDQILPTLNDIQTQSHLFSLDALPASISAHQRAQVVQLMQLIPQAQATGGFTGQYGELSIKGGRMAPFSLRDISLVEYVDNSPTLGQLALPQYRSWWPFANWGLRDSNLSADFPTSAQIAIKKYKSEVGHNVDGVILFTPILVQHVLQVIGPIHIGGYNDTITAQNVEERLHYYQQDNAGLAKQAVYQPGDTTTSSRKRFTSLLAHMLLDRVRHAPPDEILAIARQALHDLKTKDLQIYVTNPQVESVLEKFGDAAQVDRSTTHDGLYVVQANVSASKASQFVRTIMHDTVTLNTDGGATHIMQLRLVYNQVGPVYGYDTYHDYVRVYVPPTSKFLWGDGFDTGTPLCGATYVDCPQNGVYPKNELQCPPGQYQPGASAPSISDEDGARWHPLDTVGPPTNFQSDEPGRAMFGGWVVVPKNCTMTVTLSWYVPPTGHTTPYALLVQRQAGTMPELDLTILPTPGNCSVLKTAGQYFDGILAEDTSFALKPMPAGAHVKSSCYPQPAV